MPQAAALLLSSAVRLTPGRSSSHCFPVGGVPAFRHFPSAAAASRYHAGGRAPTRCSGAGAAGSEGGDGAESLPPSFPENIYAPAIDLLSDPYFSPDPSLEEKRREILGTEPLFMITFRYQREAKELNEDPLERRKMAADLGLSREALLQFFNQPFDRILAEAGIYPLRRSDIVNGYLKRHVERPESQAIFDGHNHQTENRRRDYPLSYVVGPVGSGKTFFALRYLRDFGNARGLPSVLVYWQPWIWHEKVDFAGDAGPADLVERFFERMGWRTEIGYERRWNPRDDKLSLHVCLVLDEADNREQLGFFERRSMVTEFVRQLEATSFAASLMVVVVGSFLDGELVEFDEARDAHVFRMRQEWSSDDVRRLWVTRSRPSDP